jgi:hypothetical protein
MKRQFAPLGMIAASAFALVGPNPFPAGAAPNYVIERLGQNSDTAMQVFNADQMDMRALIMFVMDVQKPFSVPRGGAVPTGLSRRVMHSARGPASKRAPISADSQVGRGDGLHLSSAVN